MSPGEEATSFDNLAAMQRRRDTARRSVPLESGYRDPAFGYQRDGQTIATLEHRDAVLEGLRALWRLADPEDRPVVERIARRVHEGTA